MMMTDHRSKRETCFLKAEAAHPPCINPGVLHPSDQGHKTPSFQKDSHNNVFAGVPAPDLQDPKLPLSTIESRARLHRYHQALGL